MPSRARIAVVRMTTVAIAPEIVEGDDGRALSIAELGESQSPSILQLRLPRCSDLCQSSHYHSFIPRAAGRLTDI